MAPQNRFEKMTAGRFIFKPFSELIDIHGILLGFLKDAIMGL
jgi:hypothetical protein